jgi:hypothetical protein
LPDTRTHRGPHPEDARLFGPGARPQLREATSDLCWLLSRGYVNPSALKLVGDRFRLTARQRVAVERAACSDADLARREAHRVDGPELEGRPLWLDGYNVLTTVEAALAGGAILAARDGTYRDMASMHGSYRKVAETRPALERIGRVIAALGVAECCWYLDRPVSNSGRLKKVIEEIAAEQGWTWAVELVPDPDPVLSETDQIVATADSVILDRCRRWFNLARETITQHLPDVDVLELP